MVFECCCDADELAHDDGALQLGGIEVAGVKGDEGELARLLFLEEDTREADVRSVHKQEEGSDAREYGAGQGRCGRKKMLYGGKGIVMVRRPSVEVFVAVLQKVKEGARVEGNIEKVAGEKIDHAEEGTEVFDCSWARERDNAEDLGWRARYFVELHCAPQNEDLGLQKTRLLVVEVGAVCLDRLAEVRRAEDTSGHIVGANCEVVDVVVETVMVCEDAVDVALEGCSCTSDAEGDPQKRVGLALEFKREVGLGLRVYCDLVVCSPQVRGGEDAVARKALEELIDGRKEAWLRVAEGVEVLVVEYQAVFGGGGALGVCFVFCHKEKGAYHHRVVALCDDAVVEHGRDFLLDDGAVRVTWPVAHSMCRGGARFEVELECVGPRFAVVLCLAEGALVGDARFCIETTGVLVGEVDVALGVGSRGVAERSDGEVEVDVKLVLLDWFAGKLGGIDCVSRVFNLESDLVCDVAGAEVVVVLEIGMHIFAKHDLEASVLDEVGDQGFDGHSECRAILEADVERGLQESSWLASRTTRTVDAL